MTKKRKMYFVATILFSVILFGYVYGKNMYHGSGLTISLQSKILGENRTMSIHLPDNYENSGSTYPVMFQLDGDIKQLRKSVSAIQRLSRKSENTLEMIVVAIENTNRSRDMWPTHTQYYPESQPLGSINFLSFIEKELIPYIESNYRVNNNRIIYGQSLSAVFTLYAFLTKPHLFNSYIACSGAFPDCEPFFTELANNAFLQIDQFENKKLIITHGLKDPLDPDGTVHHQMTDFSKSIELKLGQIMSVKYLSYENEGHVPKSSLHDGLAYLFDWKIEK